MKIEHFSSLLVVSFYWLCLCSHELVASSLCLDDQKSFLLQLKNNLTFESDSSSKLKWWNASDDCCKWIGVTCDEEGHVTGLDLSRESISSGFDNSCAVFSLQHLQKLSFAENNFNSVIPSGLNKLEKLTYLNLSFAGFVGHIPTEISQLTRLVTLDLYSLSFLTGQELKLEGPELSKLVQNLTSIKQLYLDGVTISASGHEWSSALISLHNLQELSLSHCNLSGPIDPSLARLENLSVIVLDQNNLSSSVPVTFAHLKNLAILSLADCGLIGTFPPEIFSIKTLSIIDISFNNNLHGFFPDFPPGRSLRTIIVSNTNFSGAFPHSIGNLRNLSELDFSDCQFYGTIPASLSHLTELSYLDLSRNNFTGQLPSFDMAKKLTYLHLSRNGLTGTISSSFHFEALDNLVSIDLGFNSFTGSIPSTLFTLPLLQMIVLSHNEFSQLDDFINVSSSILKLLDLSSNNLSGPFPAFIFQLSTLSALQMPSNKFNGLVQLNKLLQLRNLTTLDLSYNNLSVNVSATNVDGSSISITTLNLASCNLKIFPGFLRNHLILTHLDLSDNQIQGKVPNWIWKPPNLNSLNISHNLLTHLEGPLQNISPNLFVLDLHYNKLQGPIPVFNTYTEYLDYSSNKFSSFIPQDIGNCLSTTIFLSFSNNTLSGSIPDSLCNASCLQVLDLSINNISGTIPSCLMTMSDTLGVLNMRKSNLTGPIPDMFSAACALRTLDLYQNKIDGKIPKSLSNCKTLEVLDLGRNEIMDVFPCLWINISSLRVLALQKNKLHGQIECPNTNGTWHKLQIIDLAINNFSGKLPGTFFTNTRWEAMMSRENQAASKVNQIRYQFLQYGGQIYYEDSVTVTTKGQRMELVKILTAFTSIDFSSNNFEGEIPKELFNFKALYTLNLSNNVFSGQIPPSIGNLKELECLDLSKNSLEGNIPTELATLSFSHFQLLPLKAMRDYTVLR